MGYKGKCTLLILGTLCALFLYLAHDAFSSSARRRWLNRQEAATPFGFLYDSTETRTQSEMARDPILKLTSPNTDRAAAVSLPSSSRPIPPPSGGPAAALNFDPHGNDTLLVIHTQKTGGSEFLRHLITLKKDGEYLCQLPSELRETLDKRLPVHSKHMIRSGSDHQLSKRRKNDHQTISCPRDPSKPAGEQWLIAEKTMRWICGPHASLTEYTNCLPTLTNPRISTGRHRRMHHAVILRHPVLRYLSEYFHVQRNATWSWRRKCGGRAVSDREMPPCYPGFYQGKPWTNLTLSKYVSCESNWANNRQTMMLADLESVHCFNRSAMSREERDRQLLESAKSNLRSFSFFGLTEYMSESCLLFERTFGMTFTLRPITKNLTDLHSGPILADLWNDSALFPAIERANHLDVQLYDYALGLFAERAGRAGIGINRGLVEQEVRNLRSNPELLSKSSQKYRHLDFSIS